MIGDEDSIKRPRDTDIGSFGFEQVSFDEKTRRVRGVFNSVSGRYDLMNDLMSLGFHRWWKTYAVEILEVETNQKVLDIFFIEILSVISISIELILSLIISMPVISSPRYVNFISSPGFIFESKLFLSSLKIL